MLILMNVVMFMQVCPNIEADQMVQFKYVHLIVCKFYLNDTVKY